MPNPTPAPSLSAPRALLRHLYDVAVQRALPLHNPAASLPKPPTGRTLWVPGRARFARYAIRFFHSAASRSSPCSIVTFGT